MDRFLLNCQPWGVFATAYQRPGGEGLLMFISKLADCDVDATVALHSDQLGWKGISKVWDAVSREAIATDNGTVRLQLGPWA